MLVILAALFKSYLRVKVGVGRRWKNGGVALVEFALVLPFLMLIVFGLIRFGALLWQLQLAADALRHGARLAAHQSNWETNCEELEAMAETNALTYLSNAKVDRFGEWAKDPTASFRGSTRDGVTMEFIQVSLASGDVGCIFCYGAFLRMLNINLDATFALENLRNCGS